MNIGTFIKRKSTSTVESEPVILNLAKRHDRTRLERLIAKGAIRYVVEDYEEQEKEYFQTRNPQQVYAPDFHERFAAHFGALKEKGPSFKHGRWVYFPWLSALVHLLEDKAFQVVRTARNRNLITEGEQRKFYGAVIGIAGLSVGNSVALAIVLQGGGERMRLADHDRLALSNMNRVRAGAQNLGLQKVEMTARQIYEINPYARLELFPQGLHEKNIRKFFLGPPRLDVMIDEMDDLAMKFLIRQEARRHRIPVIMAADNGDNGVVDIERYDLNPKTAFFHGRMGRVDYKRLKSLDKVGTGKLITKHVGAENVTERMQQSLLEIGRTIVSWPQLGGAALLNGSAVAYCVRRIVNGQSLEKNRALVSLDEKIIPFYHSRRVQARRKRISRQFAKRFGL